MRGYLRDKGAVRKLFFQDDMVADNRYSRWNKGKGCLVAMSAQRILYIWWHHVIFRDCEIVMKLLYSRLFCRRI